MSLLERDRDGTIYRIKTLRVSPPSSDKENNKTFYEIGELIETCNELLDRVYELEKLVAGVKK